jgi:DNA invertase Pin-like site-specific DNA recombinase
VPIIFGDLPQIDGSAASRLNLQIMAAVAEFERRRTGERMKDWWRQRKAQGLPAGCPRNMTREGRVKGAKNAAKERTARAIDEMTDVADIAKEKRDLGWSFSHIAKHLNVERYKTRRGKAWRPVQVMRVLERLERKG